MFLKKVYRYSKPLGVGMLFFVLVQLFCFYKGGMVFSPWYNYGMYSERIMIDSVYPVNIVGNLKGSSFSPQRWDKIHYTLQQYQMLAKNDSLYEKEIRRIYQNMHLPFAKKDNYISITVANDWYQQLILKTLSTKEVYQKIHSSVYRWDGEGLDTVPINLRN